MSKIRQLLQNYGDHIAVPWREDAAPAQRVIFCVYRETDERTLRAKVDEFDLVTREAGYDWCHFDLTDTFACWLSRQRYAKKYFAQPELLTNLLPRYLDYIGECFERFVDEQGVHSRSVVAVSGVGSLFGLVKVKDVVDRVAPLVNGRLLVFFPGSFENNNYRLLDGYDGWNYLAIPITADKTL